MAGVTRGARLSPRPLCPWPQPHTPAPMLTHLCGLDPCCSRSPEGRPGAWTGSPYLWEGPHQPGMVGETLSPQSKNPVTRLHTVNCLPTGGRTLGDWEGGGGDKVSENKVLPKS